MAREKQRIVLFKNEAVYGIEEALDPATDAVLAYESEVERMKGPTEELNPERGRMGHGGKTFFGSPHQGKSFGVDIAGSGAADTPPAFGRLFKACGFTETINAGVSVQYDPTALTAAFGSATTALRKGADLHRTLGVRGTFGGSFRAGANPRANFTWDGLRVAPSNSAFPAGIVLTAWKDPMPVNFDNTTFTLDGVECRLYELGFEIANEVVVRVVSGVQEVLIVDRKPTWTATIESPGIATKDWEAKMAAEAPMALLLEHGVGAGKIFNLSGPAAQLTGIGDGRNEGLNTLQLRGKFLPSAGDDEVRLLTK